MAEDDPEDAPEKFCVCYRVVDLFYPAPGSVIEYCATCSSPVWRADGTPDGAENVCWQCAMLRFPGAADDVQVAVSRRQREKFHADGISDEAIELMRADAEAALRGGRLPSFWKGDL